MEVHLDGAATSPPPLRLRFAEPTPVPVLEPGAEEVVQVLAFDTIGSVAVDELADRPLTEPNPSRLSLNEPRRGEILTAHAAAMEAGIVGYTDPETGLFVFTAAYLRDRGTCCQSKCRHCPYVK